MDFRHPASRGFTLIEVMVVMVIISVVVAIGMISVDRLSQHDPADEERERLEALLQLAADRAMIEGAEYGLHFSTRAFRFLRFVDGAWVEADRDEFRRREWPDGLQPELRIEGRQVDLALYDEDESQPQILLMGTGEMTPFRLILRHRSDVDGVVLEGQPHGRLRNWREEDGEPRDQDRRVRR
ncbi:type II secretion system minor pseudopilin GspH [Natronospira sp.]|uniref:type II secretion system minor pseudopilin GspH n=1 Tax=Natronospira sp. TaxID=2024970 RepID=UPI00387354FC